MNSDYVLVSRWSIAYDRESLWDVLDELLGDRPLRSFAAMMSTEAEALRWARQGGVAGSVVVAAYQA